VRQHRGSFAPHALDNMPVVLGGGEASGPLIPPARGLSEDVFSCSKAAARAYAAAGGLAASDVDYFGIYDCFPICFVRALEGVGLAPPGGGGGRLVQQWYENEDAVLPLNTHGGLLGQGAPWEAPALFSLCEAVAQMTGAAGDRQLGGRNGRRNRTCDTALVYGNGGIFSASAVVVLGKRPL
jgi:acetyl-CoA acetyltransferase